MNMKRMLIVSVATLAALVGCGRQDASSSVATSEAPVTESAETTSSQNSASATSETVADNSFVEALEAAKKLGENAYSDAKFTVTAYVVDENPYIKKGSNYVSASFLIAAAADGTETMKVFNANLPTGVSKISKGQKVVVEGYLENYVKDGTSTLEITGKKDENYFARVISIEGTGNGGNVGNDDTSSSSSQTSVTPVGDNQLVFSTTTKSTLTSTEANLASKLGMDASKVTVTSTIGASPKGSNEAVINTKSGDTSLYEIRMYCGKDNTSNCSLTFTMASGLKIETIKFVFEGGDKTCSRKAVATPVVTTGGTELTGVDGVYTVNASSVKLEATTTESSAQLHVHGIEITYANA